MKARFKPNPAAIIIITCIIISITGNVCILLKGIGHPPVKVAGWGNKLLEPIDEWRVPDTIPYNKYNKLKDSMLSMRDLKNGDGFTHNLRKFAYLGTQVSLACDTCTYEWLQKKQPFWVFIGLCDTCTNKLYDGHVQYYIKLYAWSIKNREWWGDDDCVFYVKNSQGYLRESFEDTTKNHLASDRIYLDDVPVKFRYSNKDDALLIPVSKRSANLFSLICRMLNILYAIGMVAILYPFIRLVFDLSRGISFTRKNVARLRFIALCVTAYPVLVILVNLLMKLVFHSYFTGDVVLKEELWTDAWDALPAGILFSLLYMAFSRALALQEEHDLTV